MRRDHYPVMPSIPEKSMLDLRIALEKEKIELINQMRLFQAEIMRLHFVINRMNTDIFYLTNQLRFKNILFLGALQKICELSRENSELKNTLQTLRESFSWALNTLEVERANLHRDNNLLKLQLMAANQAIQENKDPQTVSKETQTDPTFFSFSRAAYPPWVFKPIAFRP